MFLHRSFVPGLAIYSYMVGDEASGRCAVIDPTRDVEPYMRTAREQGLRITDILETHVHADFISGAMELKARLPYEARIHCSGFGGAEWTPPYADAVIGSGGEVSLGSLRLKALHTPGHTPEHVSWALFDKARSDEVPWILFTGDFLFVGDIGRPDLLGPETQQRLPTTSTRASSSGSPICRIFSSSSRPMARVRSAARRSDHANPRPSASSAVSIPPCASWPRRNG